MKKLTLALLVLLGTPISTLLADSANDFFAPYAILLERYVHMSYKDGIDTTLIEYDDLAQDPAYLQAIGLLFRSDPKSLATKKEKMAYWINAYNLLTIHLIIQEGEKESIKKLGTLIENAWRRHAWKINDKEYTLYDIEHTFLRKLEDPRIHMALVCASLSCPSLKKEPYTAQHIEAQLDQQSRRFLSNKTKGLAIKKDHIVISSIFQWYKSDFGGRKGVINFLRQHNPDFNSSVHTNDPVIKYFAYNWDLNDL